MNSDNDKIYEIKRHICSNKKIPVTKIPINDYWISPSQEDDMDNQSHIDDIILITQFYQSDNDERHKENIETLKFNIFNKNITRIILLLDKELDDFNCENNMNKITKININRRLQYKDVFDIIDNLKLNGYIIIANSDIFFDNKLTNIYKSKLFNYKKIYCQLRYEYSEYNLNKCQLYGPRTDSQDAWIFHSKYNISSNQRKIFNFELGIPGCDNHIVYLFNILGYNTVNNPAFIPIYHNHSSQFRTYTEASKKAIKPWLCVYPVLNKSELNIDKSKQNNYNMFGENSELFNYIKNCINTNQNFIIPRIAGIENNIAYYGYILKFNNIEQTTIDNILSQLCPIMKNNAGIKISSKSSIIKYSELYLKAFDKCDIFTGWDPWGNVYRGISESHNFITDKYYSKEIRWALVYDIFHYIYTIPWTHALKNKRLLIITGVNDSIKKQVKYLDEIYGINLFPNCEFVFIDPPKTNGSNNSDEFDIELDRFNKKIYAIKDDFDIALCACGGYGNLIISMIYDIGKSAIYIGAVLQMYFGVFGNRWLTERSDVIRLFLNKYWRRPDENEKPSNFNSIENACYW